MINIFTDSVFYAIIIKSKGEKNVENIRLVKDRK